MRRLPLLAIAGASMLLALIGCVGSGSAPTASPPPTPTDGSPGTAQPTTTDAFFAFPAYDELDGWCPRDVAAVHLHQPADAVTDAVVCTAQGDASGAVTVTVNTITGGLDELLAAYDVPNATIDPELMCTLPIVDPLLVWLTYPGERTYPVYAPVDACGFPSADATAAYTALKLTPVVSFTSTPDGVTATVIGLGGTDPQKETA